MGEVKMADQDPVQQDEILFRQDERDTSMSLRLGFW